MCNQMQAMTILKEIYTQCNPVLDNCVRDAYLYGSYARGDYHEESDLDILLTVEQSPEFIAGTRRQIGYITSELSLKYDVTISLTIKPLSQFQKYSDVLPYYKNVLREGIRYAS